MKILAFSILLAVMAGIGCGGDSVLPLVEITNPSDGQTVSGTVTVTVSANDDQGVTRVDILINDTLAVSLTAEPYNYSWPTESLPDSTHFNIVAKAYDDADNEGVSPVVSVMVDNTVPSSNILIWNYDPADKYYDPEVGDTIDCAYWLEQALTANGHTYIKTADLPAILDSFDVIFATLGYNRAC